MAFLLSQKAIGELKQILTNQFGKSANRFSTEDLNNFGIRLLKVTATVLESQMRRQVEVPDVNL